MKKVSLSMLITMMGGCIILMNGCSHSEKKNASSGNQDDPNTAAKFGGYANEVAWGEHLVIIGQCHDCHTPKKIGPSGIELDMNRALSGHPSDLALPQADRVNIEKIGYMVTSPTITGFIGPWGISYAANISSDTTTGIGIWTLDQFIRTFRLGKFAGAPKGRDILPPMPWENVKQMRDDELKAMFAYLQSTKPIHNVVPQPEPPVTAGKMP